MAGRRQSHFGEDPPRPGSLGAPNTSYERHLRDTTLADWWLEAQKDFARLAPPPQPPKPTGEELKESGGAFLTLNGKQLPDVRRALIGSLKKQLVPIGVLVEFQVAGVFVNWWDSIKYDLKTIMTNGWSPTLIPDRYLIEAFFQKEAKEIEELEASIGETESALVEAVETAQALVEYELDEDESLTPKLMRDELKTALNDFTRRLSEIDQATKMEELKKLTLALKQHKAALDTLKKTEETLKELKRKLEQNQFDLEVKLGLKKFGPEEETWDAGRLAEQAGRELAALEAETEQDKEKKAKARRLRGDIATLERRIGAIERLSDSIGGVITGLEAKELILRKHHDLVADQLNRYLNAENRALLLSFENLWEKYAIASTTLEQSRVENDAALMASLRKLEYLRCL